MLENVELSFLFHVLTAFCDHGLLTYNSRNTFTIYNLHQRLCKEVVNIYIMDSTGKEHSSDKKTEQPGTCLM